MTTPARVVNRGLAAVAGVVIVVGLAFGIWGQRTNSSGNGSSSTDSTTPVTLPDMTGARPANTDGSWFTSNGAAEQYDYPMAELSCGALEQYLTTDLCAVARTAHGVMMLVATEGYWDPKEPDSDGVVRVPLFFQVFTHTTVGGPPRATSVLDGELYVDYAINATNPDSVSLFRAVIGGNEVLLLEHQSGYGSTTMDHVQVLAMNSTGAPTLVAAYQGDNMRIASARSALMIVANRYGPPKGNQCCDTYATVWTLAPDSTGNSWVATEQSHATPEKILEGTSSPLNMGTYEFPQKYGTSNGA